MKSIRFLIILPAAVVAISALAYWQVRLAEAGGDMAIQLPRPSGPFGVGRTRFDWTDPNRQDRFHPSLKRRLVVWVWYPAHATGLNSPAAYVPGKWGESAARWSAITIRLHMSPNALRAFTTSAPVSPASIQHIRVHAVEDAPIADDRKNFPVLIFSPGLVQMPTDYTGLIEDLASHGYIVAGINPTYFTDVTVFADGTEAGHMPVWKRSWNVEDYYPIWLADFLFVTNQISKLNHSVDARFAKRLDLSRLGAFGHSYGGAAAIGACHRDARFKAGIDLDGSPRGGAENNKLKQPFLVLQSDQGVHRDRAQVRLAKNLDSGHLFVIQGAHHAAFTDAALLPLAEPGRSCWLGSLAGARMLCITSTVVRSFFDATLSGKAEGLTAVERGEFPELRIER